MADLLFDWLEFDQTSETVLHSTKAKQLNPNKLNKRLSGKAEPKRHPGSRDCMETRMLLVGVRVHEHWRPQLKTIT